jgi:hypothetical protein
MRIKLVFVAIAALAGGRAFSQSPQPSPAPAQNSEAWPARAARMSRDAEKAGLAEPFRGITTDGKVQPGLFRIFSTGVSTEPMRTAVTAWLATLSAEQRAKASFAIDDVEWRKWMNQDFYVRQGVSFKEMSEPQRVAAFGLMKAALSAKGLQLSQDIMKLNETLGELNNNDFVRYGERAYWITVMGTPSATQPWGFQIDGHHLIINYFVLGDQVVMSPLFVGSEPVIATSGKYKGVAILQEEQNRGVKLLLALDEPQRKRAVLDPSKPGNNILTEAFKDNVVLDYAGARAKDFTAAQKQALLELIELFVSNLEEGHARVKMDEVRAHLDETCFAWIGGSAPEGVFYYRIHSPVVLIEFDHQRPVGTRQLFSTPNVPTRQHIHVVVRTPNGNDYGKDLLRQHLLAHPH